MTPNIVQFCNDPPQKKKKKKTQKTPQNLHTSKKYSFSVNPKNIEIQNFEPQKMTRAYVHSVAISEFPNQLTRN